MIPRLIRVRTRRELLEFQREAKRELGVLFPEDYLLRSRVFLLRDATGRVRGGFLLCLEGPFRAIEGIPAGPRNKALQRIQNKSCLEGSGMWLDRSLDSPFARLTYWSGLVLEALKTGRRYWIVTYSKGVGVLDQIHGSGVTEVLYEGPVFLEGMDQPDREKVVLADAARKVAYLMRNPGLFLRRVTRRRRPLGGFGAVA